MDPAELEALRARARAGGPRREPRPGTAGSAASDARHPVRERISLLVDPGSFVEDGLLANALEVTQDGRAALPADGVVTGLARIDGRPVALMANDPSVKAGSWGARTVEKIIRVIEGAIRDGVPMVYLVDSAGARITDQVDLFPGRRGAGKIFHTQVRASGAVPQVCALFGPSAAGGAYIPAFCDVVAMVDGSASMYLGSPRMVEMVVGEITSLEQMGGARVHCTESGVGHFLCESEDEALDVVRRYLAYLPSNWEGAPPRSAAAGPLVPPAATPIDEVVPERESVAFDVHDLIDGLLDADSFLEIHRLWAGEVVVGLGRLDGEPIGVVASNSAVRGGVLFNDSADKAARFVQLCDAFNVPLLFLADVPGFMVGGEVERAGIIRHGAKLVSAVAEATVASICVVVRKAYGAGLYAMCGPGFDPDATLALPTGRIAVMGAEAAVNAVHARTIEGLPAHERAAFVEARRREYEQDVDLVRLASELVIDAVVQPGELRGELINRFARARGRDRTFAWRRHGITPV